MNDVIAAFVADLMFQTRIESVAERLDMQVQWIDSADQVIAMDVDRLATMGLDGILVERLTRMLPKLLIFDLGNKAIPWATWIPALKSDHMTRRIPVICFGSHVDVGTLKTAREVGADEVLARSRFVMALPELIQKYVCRRDEESLVETCDESLHQDAINGLEFFNSGDYYGAHEYLEEAWKDDLSHGRELYQGILQIAVAYFHIQKLNYQGALKMFQRARKWLDLLPDTCRGIDVAQFRVDAYAVHNLILELGPERISELSSERMKPVVWGLG